MRYSRLRVREDYGEEIRVNEDYGEEIRVNELLFRMHFTSFSFSYFG
jgi:hypothetical protein